MKKLYTSQNRVLIYLLKDKLDEHHISTYFKNETPPLAGEIPAAIARPELWIMNDGEFTKANEIVQQELAMQTQPSAAWQCPHCGETLEGQFNICWKCGAQRE